MPVSVDKAVIARYEKFGKKFEILVDPEKAISAKSGKSVAVEEIVAVNEIYEDAKKGMRASKEDLHRVFGTDNFVDIAKIIISRGDVQITAEQKRKMLEEKKRQVATLISKHGINPQTNTPHPIERILNAMERARVTIDLYKSAEEQVNEVLPAIQRVLPIRLEKITLKIKIPPAHSAKCYGVIRKLGTVKREEWLGDGSLYVLIEIPAGMQPEVYERLSALTRGDVSIEQVQ